MIMTQLADVKSGSLFKYKNDFFLRVDFYDDCHIRESSRKFIWTIVLDSNKVFAFYDSTFVELIDENPELIFSKKDNK